MRHLNEAAVTAMLLGPLLGAVGRVQADGSCNCCPDAGRVLSQSKISATAGGFDGPLDTADAFGHALAYIGDLDGDGIGDCAVGAFGDDDGGPNRGAVWVLFLNANGTVKSQQKISSTAGGFAGPLHDLDQFGVAVASPGDVDGDGIADLAVGACLDDDGGTGRGAVWVLFLNANGTVRSQQKISSSAGGFAGPLHDLDQFGVAVASPGDVDGDGIADLAVGAWLDDDGGLGRGAVWVLFLNANGTVKSQQKISSSAGGFAGPLLDGDVFGFSVAAMGDVDGDGVVDLAAGAVWDDDGGADRGAVWVLFLNANGTVKSQQKISSIAGGFTGLLHNTDVFGVSVASMGDLDGDGVLDLAVGALGDDDGGPNRGAVWVLFLNADGTVKSQRKISSTAGSFAGPLHNDDMFGAAVASPGDLDGDGVVDLAVGVQEDDDGYGENVGAVWNLRIDGCAPTVAPLGDFNEDCAVNGADLGILLGGWATPTGDLNNDGTTDGADLGILLGTWGECSSSLVLLSEDFESGSGTTWPPGWSAIGVPNPGGFWHVAVVGECGAESKRAAFNSGDPACNYGNPPFTSSNGVLSSPSFIVTQATLSLSFQYTKVLDTVGNDTVSILLRHVSSGTDYLFVANAELAQTAVQLSFTDTKTIPSALVGQAFRLVIGFNGDSTGNSGSGLTIDDLVVTGVR